MQTLHALFQLDPEIAFLNHGSFGATPKPVFEVYQQWQQRIERQPVQFFMRELAGHLAEARQALSAYLNVAKDDLVYVPNATYGANVVANSLKLEDGDELLTTNHEYGACAKAWQFHSQRRGFQIKVQDVPLPVPTADETVDLLWQGVTPRTKVIFLSHISSATAVIFPITDICSRAREEGILTVIDGAHAPGQIELDLQAIDPDFYCGNLHKWVSAPKGSAFLYARPDKQHLIEPLIVSWGWGEPKGISYGSDFLDYLQFTGTNDLSAYLTVPAAIEFQAKHNWTAVREACHALLKNALKQLAPITKQPSPYPDASYYRQMAIVPLPKVTNLAALKEDLYDQFKVEIPCIEWNGYQFIRLSIQGYNSQDDIDKLVEALTYLLPKHRT